MIDLNNIVELNNVKSIESLNKGWSRDKKYIITTDKDKYLLRISDISLYEKKKKQFELLKRLEELDINCSRPIGFGKYDEHSIYMVLSYLEGEDAEKVIPTLLDKEAYKLGIEAGKVLQKLHSIPVPEVDYTWKKKYEEKIPRKIKALKECEYKLPLEEFLIDYFISKSYLMDNRPLLFSHADFHAGNMIVNNGKIGIIDFDKNTISDPYDEF